MAFWERWSVAKIKNTGGQIDVQDHFFDNCARLNKGRITNQQRHTNARLVHRPFIHHAVFPEKKAVV